MKKHRPSACRRANVDAGLVFDHIELPPKHAAIFVEKISPERYTRVTQMVRERKCLAGHSRAAEPRKRGNRPVACILSIMIGALR